MAVPKFPLAMGDGAKVRTIEELREHADLYTLEQYFRDGTLVRWLKNHSYQVLAAKVEVLDKEAESFHEELCSVLGIHMTEEMKTQYAEKTAPVDKEECDMQKAEETTDTGPNVHVDIFDEELVRSGSEEALEQAHLDEQAADLFANILNYENHDFDFYETENYFLYASEYTKPEKNGNSGFGRGLTALFGYTYQGPQWHRRDKRTGEDIEFPIQCTDDNYMLKFTYLFYLVDNRESNHAVWNDCLIYVQEDKLICLDVGKAEIKVLCSVINGKGLRFATKTARDKVVFSNEDGLFTLNLSEENAKPISITADGKKIVASALEVTDENLYFACAESRGILSDGKRPEKRLCAYNWDKHRTSIVTEEKVSNVSCIKIFDNWLYFTIEVYALFSIGAYNLWGKTRIDDGETCLYSRKELVYANTDDNNMMVRVVPYSDGFLFLRENFDDNSKANAFFVDFRKDGTHLLLAENAQRLADVFRLGEWIYYSGGTKERRERWKVSVNGGKPIQLDSKD